MSTKTDQSQDSNSAKPRSSSRPSSVESIEGPSTPRTRALLGAAALSTFAAFGVHGYLMNEHYSLRFGQAAAHSICDINELFSCAAVSASKYSEIFGLPMALLGLMASIVLIVLLAWFFLSEGQAKLAIARNLVVVSGLIALTSIAMGSISMFLLYHLCPFCILAYLLSFINFGCVWAALGGSFSSDARKSFSLKEFMPTVVMAAITLFVAVIANDHIREGYGSEKLAPLIQEALESWKTGPVLNFTPVAPLIEGASDDHAKMVITEFADFRCSHCRHAAPVIKAFVSANPDVQLRFEAWPLDGECNTSIASNVNGASCLLARAVNCAEQIAHTGWKAHAYIYEHQEDYGTVDAIHGALAQIAAATDVKPEQMAACTDSQEAKALIAKEAAVGTALNLNGTPSVFVNNKKLPYGQLLQVLAEIHKEIEATR